MRFYFCLKHSKLSSSPCRIEREVIMDLSVFSDDDWVEHSVHGRVYYDEFKFSALVIPSSIEAMKDFEVREDDIFIHTYSKSGKGGGGDSMCTEKFSCGFRGGAAGAPPPLKFDRQCFFRVSYFVSECLHTYPAVP